ncbi:polymerase delta-interacting protein 3-like [Limulus polyphemus]|uniref:Polymerase delta-interacting protein 3-like n=1 Tax=Limulus polyphemus TaxID=6850 RepID=A0ABM1BVJ9_LIMPO|nr:polymerase delta-interacting protein 3-like [Limulus polyphemus]
MKTQRFRNNRGGNLNFGGRNVTDARQIIKARRGQELPVSARKNGFLGRGQTFNLKRKVKNEILIGNRKNQVWNKGKVVQLSGGMITVTSPSLGKQYSNKKVQNDEKTVLINNSQITVTKPISQAVISTPMPKVKPTFQKSLFSNTVQLGDKQQMNIPCTSNVIKKQFSSPQNVVPASYLSPLNEVPSMSTSYTYSALAGRKNVKDRIEPATLPTEEGHTIVVSNLPLVTEDDMKELFGDIGPVLKAAILHQGTAIVTYSRKEDAVRACQVYHNCPLDGNPMQCSLLPESKTEVVKPSRPQSYLSGGIKPSFLRSQGVGKQINQTASPPPQMISTPSASSGPVKFTVRMP